MCIVKSFDDSSNLGLGRMGKVKVSWAINLASLIGLDFALMGRIASSRREEVLGSY